MRMRWFVLRLLACLAAVGVLLAIPGSPAAAQVTSGYNAQPISADGHTLSQLEESSRRVRVALYYTTGVFGAGVILTVAGTRQCNNNTVPNANCDRAGKALLGVGVPLLVSGAVGMITSGIILGLRNKTLRELHREIRERSDRKLRWDPLTSRVVF